MKESIQQKIVEEISQEAIKKKSVIGIVVFGSSSVGEERENSDVDIEIISTKYKKYILDQRKKRYGKNIDIEIIPEFIYLDIVTKYPYLWYDYYKRHKIIYDPKKIVKKIIVKLDKYYSKHPEIVKFWKIKLKEMNRMKRLGKPHESAYDVYDEAEIKFSKEHKITRNFFRLK